jgi:ferritin-like metal-binding protein YciE
MPEPLRAVPGLPIPATVRVIDQPAYESLMAWAKLLGYRDAINLLKQNEQEEKAAAAKLSK